MVIPLFYKNKESFGDADILVSINDSIDIREYIISTFKPNEIFHNGNCWSFDYKEFQIDIITCLPEHFDSNAMYLSYNDLGNLIGRLAHGFGLKYGQEGLFYEHKFKGKNIGTIYVSKDYPRIFEFLGLSFERYQEGFNELEDIFKFIAESPYFNWKSYLFENLNKVNRDRNKKRTSYISFLTWINTMVADENHEYKFVDDKTSYLIKINDFFPEANIITEIRRLEYLECRMLYIQSKFSGGNVMIKYGFSGEKLGKILSGFENKIIQEYGGYGDYIINTDIVNIYKDFENYLNELEIRAIE